MLLLTVRDSWSDGKRTHIVGTLTPQYNYVSGGDIIVSGDVLNPVHLQVESSDGYSAFPVYGESLALCRIKLFFQSGSEMVSGPYAGSTNPPWGPLEFYGIFGH